MGSGVTVQMEARSPPPPLVLALYLKAAEILKVASLEPVRKSNWFPLWKLIFVVHLVYIELQESGGLPFNKMIDGPMRPGSRLKLITLSKQADLTQSEDKH